MLFGFVMYRFLVDSAMQPFIGDSVTIWVKAIILTVAVVLLSGIEYYPQRTARRQLKL